MSAFHPTKTRKAVHTFTQALTRAFTHAFTPPAPTHSPDGFKPPRATPYTYPEENGFGKPAH